MEKYDLVVIGGGPAGYAGAMRAIDFGKKVLLIEKNKIGGAGIYNGALWSKTMWEYSQKISAIREEIPDFDVKFSELLKTTDAAVFERKFQMNCHIKLLKSEAKKQLLFYEKGYGEIVSEHEVRVMKEDHHHHDDFHSDPHQPADPISEKTVYAEHILIATGSRPRKLDNIAIDEHIIMTSDGLSNLTDFPKSMVILGAGVIGCEFATIFSNLGKTKVFLIDKAPRILPFEDEDISAMVTSNMEKNGVVIHKNSSLIRMEIKDGEVEYELSGENGKTEILRVEKALVSVGRVPNVENIGLEKVGIKLNDRGAIDDSDTQTNIENIWVAGDLTSEMALVNIAEREARHAVVRMFGPPIKPLTYRNISTIMFLNPEVAAVGMSEQECRKKGISIKVAKVDYSMLARPIAMRKTNGFFKMIVTNDSNMRVLGMRAVGEHASSAIEAVALIIYMNKGIDELGHMLHPHPSITEGIQECARMLLGKSIYKSSMFKDKLQCYTCVDNVCTPLENL